MIDRYLGKRFAGLIICAGILGAAYFVGPEAKFGALATTLGLMYGIYAGAQSFTDAKKGE